MVSIQVDPKLRMLKNDSDPLVLDEKWAKMFLRREFEYMESKACHEQAIKEWNHLVDIDNADKAEESVINKYNKCRKIVDTLRHV